MRILYQGLLRSPASWARVGRGYVSGFLELGVALKVLAARGFRHDPGFPLPEGLQEVSAAEARMPPEPDVGLGFLHPPLVGRLIGRRKVNLFVWESDVAPPQWVESLENGVDLVVVPSVFTRDALVHSGLSPARVAVCPYGHSVQESHSKESDREGRPFTFLAVMAPHLRKGVRELLEAYARAFREDDQVSLRIKSTYDPGEARRRFPFEILSWKEALDSCGLSEPGSPPVEIDLRTLDDVAVLDLYRHADVYVQPSWGESFGLAPLEAMASGLPVLATGWGGHMEFLSPPDEAIPFRLEPGGAALYEDAPGAQVARPDVAALAERMRWHRDHPQQSATLGARAREAVAGMTWTESARKLLAVIGE